MVTVAISSRLKVTVDMMVKYKNIRIKKKGGGYRMQRVRVFASGKYKFVKNPRKSRSRKTSSPKKKTRRRRSPSRKGGKRKMGRNLQQQIFKWIRIGALVGPGVADAYFHRDYGPDSMLNAFQRSYTGYDFKQGVFNMDWAVRGWSPFIVATLFTYGIPKLASIVRRL